MTCPAAKVFPGRLESLAEIRKFIKDAAVEAGVGKKAAYNLRLAVDEIASNIIMYGYEKANLAGDLTVRKELTDDVLRITLEDSGAPFDSRKRRLPSEEDLAKPLEERPIGGLGVYLAVSSVDNFDYRRENDLNCNIFEVRLRKE